MAYHSAHPLSLSPYLLQDQSYTQIPEGQIISGFDYLSFCWEDFVIEAAIRRTWFRATSMPETDVQHAFFFPQNAKNQNSRNSIWFDHFWSMDVL
jgi:hypothetical protein